MSVYTTYVHIFRFLVWLFSGSGKTAAFLLPMLERLKTHSAQVNFITVYAASRVHVHTSCSCFVQVGCRALVLSPTRELAIQTLKFAKEVGNIKIEDNY